MRLRGGRGRGKVTLSYAVLRHKGIPKFAVELRPLQKARHKRPIEKNDYCQSNRAGTPGVTGRFLFRTLELSLAFLNTDECHAHLFCSSRSPSTLVSDAKKRVVGYAVAGSVNAVG
jgi:hypothetical protein